MTFAELLEKFVSEKKDKPINVNQLLDFASLSYIDNKLSIKEYMELSRELMLRGATKPDYYHET